MPTLTVPPGSAPLRLDVFLARQPSGSRRIAQHAIAAGEVRVNGRRAHKGQRVHAGDLVQVADTLYQEPSLQPNPHLVLTILYEDTAVIAVDKPAGMPSHALRPDEMKTVANFLIARDAESGRIGKPLEAGLVHRLDTDTSGVLLAARTASAYSHLRQQFTAREVTKQYLALVQGDVAASGEVCSPIVHTGGNRRRMRVCVEPRESSRARPALTRYRPLERFADATLLAVEIPTGVMHQIRVHLTSIGHPIVGDRLYGNRSLDRAAPRQMLHACDVTFRHPETGKPVYVSSPLPADFAAMLEDLRRNQPALESRPSRRMLRRHAD